MTISNFPAGNTIPSVSGQSGNLLSTNGSQLVWSAPVAFGNMTVLASGSLTGTSLSLTSIAGTYKNLRLVIRDFYASGSAEKVNIRFNGDTTSNMHMNRGFYLNYDGAQNNAFGNIGSRIDAISIACRAADDNNSIVMDIYDYANTATVKHGNIDSSYVWTTGGTTNRMNELNKFSYVPTSAITSIDILMNGATFGGGTYILYGVN